MRTVKVIISVFLLAFVSNSFAQEIQEKKEIVDSLFKLVKKNILINNNGTVTISEPDLEKFKRLLYKAYAYAPTEFRDELIQWTEEWRSTGIKGVKPPTGIKPSTRLQKVKEKLAEKYGWEYVRFLETPYFMKVKVLDIKNSEYKLHRANKKGIEFKVQKIDILVKITDIIKGNNYYSLGDTITIGYLPIQFGSSALPEFKLNHIYAFPLKPWSRKEDYMHNNLMLKLNGLHTFYEIKNGFVYSPLTPEKSPMQSWDAFKNDFKQKFLIEE